MKLEAITVFDVAQQRTSDVVTKPKGGECTNVTPEFIESLENFSKQQGIEKKPTIEFIKPVQSGNENPVRSLILRYGFGESDDRSKAAYELAQKLAESMDERTPRLLLLLTLHSVDSKKCVTMWAFPKDDPIQFQSTKLTLRNVKNAFSKRSNFAKCARFQGVNSPNSFLRGFVIDRSSTTSTNPALYWTSRFLEGKLSLTSSHGTYQLSNLLKEVLKSAQAPSDRRELAETVVAIRASKRDGWSFQDVADEFFDESNKKRFLELAPIKDRETQFKIDPQVLESNLGFLVYTTDDGVVISTPFSPLESTSVLVKENRITVDGSIASEAFEKRVRRGGKRA